MKRRVDMILHWHCGHPCDHDADAPKAWRYAVISGDIAFALTISEKGGELVLHRAFRTADDDDDGHGLFGATQQMPVELGECDLLKGGKCVRDLGTDLHRRTWDALPMGGTTPLITVTDIAVRFWKEHAVQGQKEQPDAFWRALEGLAREHAKEARDRRYAKIKCPKCGGVGFLKGQRKRATP